MNEFDGNKFYGFSLRNDPVLSTTTRNFEFKYTRPEHLERVIQKVQHNEPEHERNRKKDVFNRLSKVKKVTPTTEISTPYRRDIDVETHVSRGDKAGRVRNLSDTEINQLIGKVKSYGDLRKQNSTDTYARGKELTKSMKQSTILRSILRPTGCEFPCDDNVGDPHHCQARPLHMDEFGDGNSCDGEMFFSDPTSEDQILCHPFELPHEPVFETHTIHLPHARRELHSGMGKLPDVPEEDELLASKTVMPTMVEEFRQPQPKWVEICETPAMAAVQLSEIKLQQDTDDDTLTETQPSSEPCERLPTNVTYTMHSHELQLPLQISTPEMMLKNQPPPPSLPNLALAYAQSSYDDNPSTYDINDSDLEYEMLGRAEYTKLCGPRPKTEEVRNNSSGGLAEFVEVEPEIPLMNLSFLKNVSPIRYSDMTDEREEDKTADVNEQMKVFIKNRSKKSASPSPRRNAPISSVKEAKKKITKAKKVSVEDSKQSPRPKCSARGADSSPVPEKSPHTPRSSGRKSTTPKQHKDRGQQIISSNELRSMKNIILTKSIEDLKMEKMTIFSKMTRMQERMIETLDKLRISLLELYVPDSHYEKTRRQKNAFEFSVRFSRNFLYPLKGMIEDLRLVSVEQLCSASSNEASQRVLNIFSLIHQSLQTYYKQLRYFLLDQVPQKLNIVIELAATAVNICLEKQVFDRNDAIIECLLERCTKFLDFLEDMHEERFLTARDNYRKTSFDKTASNYSLKMFMNDLNMYEPKLVPKNHYNHRRKPKQRRVLKPSVTNTKIKLNKETPATPKTSNMVIRKPDGDQISTKINELPNSSGLIHSITEKSVPPMEPSMNSEELPYLNKAFVEALQTVTKEQIREALQPIIQTLGTVLEKRNASKTIEELLNAFSKNLISLSEGENMKRATSAEKYSANRDKVRGDKESKVAKQTERQQRNRHSHSNNESTKRHEVAAAFFGDVCTANASETVICDIDVDDDDDNYYDDDDFENGDGDYADEVDDDNDDDDDDDGVDGDDGIGKARKTPTELTEPTEPTEPSELVEFTETTETTDSMQRLRDEFTGKSQSHNKNKTNSSNIVVFDNFKLNERTNDSDYDGNDVVSESGSDFVSFEGNPSNFDVVIAMKPDKNKMNEQQQAQQQLNNKKEQQQHKKEQQQLEKFEDRDPYKQHNHGKQQQQPERQHEKALRERTENYDTHIQQQQQLFLQQLYDEELLQRQRKKRNSTASHNIASAVSSNKNTSEEIIKQSRNLQKQLQQQLEEHQRCIIGQQQQQQLQQQQLQQHKMLEREEQQQRLLQEQQQQLHATQKPLTRKQLQSQAQQQPRGAIASRHTTRASSSRPPSSRTSPLIATSRGRLSARAKNLSSNPADMYGEKGTKVLKKRRNPLNSPPPAPSVTPSNSARTPRSTTRLGAANDAAVGPKSLHAPYTQMAAPSLRSSFTNNMCFAEDGAGLDTGTFNAPNCSESEMLKMCTKLKSDFFNMMVPLTNAFNIVASGSGGEQCAPKQSKTAMKESDVLANRDLIEALTNCLFNYNSTGLEPNAKVPSVATVKGAGDELCDTDSTNPVTLYTGESPYEKVKLQKAQQRLHKQKLLEYPKEQRREERKKGLCKNSNNEDQNDWLDENSADELNTSDADSNPATGAQNNDVNSEIMEPQVSPCDLWNASPKRSKQKKELHIEKLIAERDHFLRLCSKNRFYVNPNFNQPWSVFSKIATKLSNDVVGMIEEDFSIGVSKFVQDFLDNETKI